MSTKYAYLSESTMLNSRLLLIVAFLLICTCAYPQNDQQNRGFRDALMAGDAHLVMRYRYEFVDQDGFADDASASTMKLRLNYKTESWRDWSAFAEFDYVAEVLADNFNSGGGTSSTARSQYPVVPDPNGSDLNQLYFDYSGFSGTRVRIGRQRIIFDNQRFVGGVGWRQNEQTYDGISATYKTQSGLELFYSYVNQVNRIFGEQSTVGKHDNNTHLFEARVSLGEEWVITPYFYHIDNESSAQFSTATLGIRAIGKYMINRSTLSLAAQFATQADAANNPINYDADYLHVAADWTMRNDLTLGLGYEMLGGEESNAGRAFRTPLATLHAFQGWADKFLDTPNAGIDDLYVKANYPVNKWTLQAIYHDFSAAEGSANWGSEFDLSASRKLNDKVSLLLKAAFFKSDNVGFSDTNKIWIQVAANY